MAIQRRPNMVAREKPSIRVICPNCGIVKLQSPERIECGDCEVPFEVKKDA